MRKCLARVFKYQEWKKYQNIYVVPRNQYTVGISKQNINLWTLKIVNAIYLFNRYI